MLFTGNFMYHTCRSLSSIPSIKHGFFTRNGGVSNGIFASLNCGYGSNDDPAKVTENRKIVADKIGGTLCTVHQTHSNKAVIVDKTWEHKNAPEADAMVTNKPDILLGILTADCQPILFADGKNKIIAAAHAGWRGAIGGIIESTIEKMLELCAQRSEIIATIGPSISKESYEVGGEFYERFLVDNADNKSFFLPSANEGHFMFDLASYTKKRLAQAGISQINIIAKDTYLNDNEFFSYRQSCKRGEAAYGRQISVIRIAK